MRDPVQRRVHVQLPLPLGDHAESVAGPQPQPPDPPGVPREEDGGWGEVRATRERT